MSLFKYQVIFILFFFIESVFAQQMPFFTQPFFEHETYFSSFMGCFPIFYVILHQEIHLLKREVQKRNFLNKEYLFKE